MPDDYEVTVGKLQDYINVDYINVDHINAILSSSNATTANELILYCLIQRVSCKEELLDLFDHLENIIISHNLKIITDELTISMLIFYCIEFI